MLSEGRIPLTQAEDQAIAKLQLKHPDQPISFTRRDPGETGPVLVHVGDETHQVNANGRTKKVS